MLDVIGKRRSIRSYDGQPLAGEARKKVEELLATERVGFFGGRPRFVLFDRGADPAEKGGKGVKLGTYGFIKGVRTFLAGAITRGPGADVDYGYALEAIILELTAMGLGTCWLGGTFSRAEYGKLLSLDGDEYIPAVTPVGLSAKRRGAVDRLVRWGAKADSRLPWEALFFDQSSGGPLTRDSAGAYATVLDAVRRGPSASNRQPWRVVQDGERFHLVLVRTPGYGKLVAATDLQRIDMGIAMCHFEAGAKALGLPGSWRLEEPAAPLLEHGEYVVTWVTGE
jgi:nitroreductase